MTPERFEQAGHLFDRFVSIPEEEWAGLLEAECSGDAELRGMVMSMLAGDADTRTDLLSEPLVAFGDLDVERGRTSRETTEDVRTELATLFARDGRYEDPTLVGLGGMGLVFRAFDTKLRKDVAVKVLHVDTANGRNRLLREARAAADLDHSGIVSVLDVQDQGGLAYIVMDFVRGEGLDERLRRGLFTPDAAARFVLRVADAMGHAHARSLPVVHRDLKPANILVDVGGQPRITDFGIAKLLDGEGHTHDGAICGTPRYMSPEQADGRNSEVSPASDVYAIGVVLYELLTGRVPSADNGDGSILERIRLQDPVPPRSIDPRIPVDLETICLKCLQKDPMERLADGHELRDELERFLEGNPLNSRSYSTLERLLRNFSVPQHDVRFDRWREQAVVTVLILLIHVTLYGLLLARAPEPVCWLCVCSFTVPVLWVLRTTGSVGVMPSNPAERLLWAIWTGHAVCIVAGFVAYRLAADDYVAGFLSAYPMLLVVTALAYLVMGAGFARVNSYFAVVLLATAIALPITGTHAPLVSAIVITAINVAHVTNMRWKFWR